MRRKGKNGAISLAVSMVIAIVIVGFSSCSPIMYVPNTINSPLLSKQWECKAAVTLGNSGYNGLLAFSPIKHVGIIANGSKNNTPEPEYFTYNVGCGYYGKIPKWFDSNYEFYVGGGKGEISDNDDFLHRHEEGNFTQYFAQMGWGLEYRYYGLGLALRVNYIDMNIYNFYFSKNYSYGNFFYEPALTFKMGYSGVKFIFQVAGSLKFNNTKPADEYDFEYTYSYRSFVFSFGVQLTLGRSFLASDMPSIFK